MRNFKLTLLCIYHKAIFLLINRQTGAGYNDVFRIHMHKYDVVFGAARDAQMQGRPKNAFDSRLTKRCYSHIIR